MAPNDPSAGDTARAALLPAPPPGKNEATTAPIGPDTYDAVRSLRNASVPVLTLLHHPDLRRVGERAALHGLLSGDKQAFVSRDHPEFRRPGACAPLDDSRVSRTPIRFAAEAEGAIRVTRGESRTNLVHRGEPVHDAHFPAEAVKRGVVLEIPGFAALLLHTEPSLLQDPLFEPTGESHATSRLDRDVRAVADMDMPVLIRGETGTGKEIVARRIHDTGKRRGAAFVNVNVAAIPAGRVAEELFGARAGERGALRRAQGGTILFDFVEEAPPQVQAALVRLLETGEIEGPSGRTEKVDVRVLAASRLGDRQSVAERALSAPLLYRLAAYEIWIPPLRERRDDIARLLVRFLREELERAGDAGRLDQRGAGNRAWLPSSLVAQLAELDWPGNVRQLRNVVQQIVVSSRGQPRVELPPPVRHLIRESLPKGSLTVSTPERAPSPVPSRPWVPVVLEFARSKETDDEYGFHRGQQSYVVRGPGGRFDVGRLDWTEVIPDLDALCRPNCPPEVTQGLGDLLQRFLKATEWGRHEDLIMEKVEQRQQRVALTIRSAAAELYALPWELLTFRANGRPVGAIPDVLVRYEWPATSTAALPETTLTEATGRPPRLLVAGSGRGGWVPWKEHYKAIKDAAAAGEYPFDPERDVIKQVSCGKLVAALDSAKKEGQPVGVLHLLCHGGLRGETFQLILDGEVDDDKPVYVDATAMSLLLAPYAATLRLVVLSACDSANTGKLGNHVGSVAQALHRAGIQAVVASRFPLSVDGSIRFTTTFYTELLARRRPIVEAFIEARTALTRTPGQLDWAALQLYARDADDEKPRGSGVPSEGSHGPTQP